MREQFGPVAVPPDSRKLLIHTHTHALEFSSTGFTPGSKVMICVLGSPADAGYFPTPLVQLVFQDRMRPSSISCWERVSLSLS